MSMNEQKLYRLSHCRAALFDSGFEQTSHDVELLNETGTK